MAVIIHAIIHNQKLSVQRTKIFRDNWGNSVGIATGYGLGVRGSIPGICKEIFLRCKAFIPAVGPTQPPIQLVRTLSGGGIEAGA
jgi:hypothetical protein